VLVLDMIEILPPLGKYKYDTWRILPMKCDNDNSVRLRSCIRNVIMHFWHRCRGGSQYLLSIYRLHGIILTSIISLTDLSAALFLVVTGKCFVGPESLTVHHLFLRFMGFLRSSSTTPRTSRAAAKFESTDSQAREW
jgi:hypothetical protein